MKYQDLINNVNKLEKEIGSTELSILELSKGSEKYKKI
jgi:hypothetical protein